MSQPGHTPHNIMLPAAVNLSPVAETGGGQTWSKAGQTSVKQAPGFSPGA